MPLYSPGSIWKQGDVHFMLIRPNGPPAEYGEQSWRIQLMSTGEEAFHYLMPVFVEFVQ